MFMDMDFCFGKMWITDGSDCTEYECIQCQCTQHFIMVKMAKLMCNSSQLRINCLLKSWEWEPE